MTGQGHRKGYLPPRLITVADNPKREIKQRNGMPVRNLREMLTDSPWKIEGEALTKAGVWQPMKWRLDGLYSIWQMENDWDLIQEKGAEG